MQTNRTDPLIAEVERLRASGLTRQTAIELVADRHDLDPEGLTADHFAWRFGQRGEAIYEDIEERSRSMNLVSAIAVVAELHDLDAELLTMTHFEWQLDQLPGLERTA